MTVRAGEKDRSWFRSERFCNINGRWFFSTREGTQEGPFSHKREAEMELMLYVRHANDVLVSRS